MLRRWLTGPSLEPWDEPSDWSVSDRDGPGEGHQQVLEIIRTMQRRSGGLTFRRRIRNLRRAMDEAFGGRDHGAEIRPRDGQRPRGEWVLATGADPRRRMLYIHGGAFLSGSPRSHRPLCADLSRQTGAAVFSLDYRLLPEHTRRACLADCRSAYRWILEEGPDGPTDLRHLFVAGDSAGGNLALVTATWARDHAARLPDAVLAFSPSTDSTFSSPSLRENRDSDPMLRRGLAPLLRWRLLGLLFLAITTRMRPCHPALSPVFGNLAGLPPTLVQASEAEMLLDDSVRYVNKARAAGSPAVLQTWPHMVHVFQAFADSLEEGREALKRVALFVEEHAPRGEDAESS